jgi:hypothetical protein
MMWIVAIPITVIVLFMLYTYVLLPRMNKKHEAQNKTHTEAFALSIKGQEEQIRKTFLTNSTLIQPIVAHLQDDQIQAIISCMEFREMKDFTKQMLMNLAAKVLARGAGSALREQDNEDIYYLVLSQSKLYYLHFDTDGDLVQQMDFERNLMQHIEVGAVVAKEMTVNAAIAMDSERIGFQFANKEYKFFFYKQLYAHPNANAADDTDLAYSQINYLFAEPFKKFVAKYRV